MPSDDQQVRNAQATRQLVWEELVALAAAIAAGPADALDDEITAAWMQRAIAAQLRLIQAHEPDATGRCVLCKRRPCTVTELLLAVYAESWLVTGTLDTNLHPSSSLPANPADPDRWRHRRAQLGS